MAPNWHPHVGVIRLGEQYQLKLFVHSNFQWSIKISQMKLQNRTTVRPQTGPQVSWCFDIFDTPPVRQLQPATCSSSCNNSWRGFRGSWNLKEMKITIWHLAQKRGENNYPTKKNTAQVFLERRLYHLLVSSKAFLHKHLFLGDKSFGGNDIGFTGFVRNVFGRYILTKYPKGFVMEYTPES